MAAQDLEKLVVQLSADIRKYENALTRAQGVTNQRARAIETRFARMNKTINSGASAAAIGVGKAFALVGGVQGFKSLSDAATGIDNALKVAGLSGAELESVYQQLYAAATKNAAPIETLVTMYGRLALVQKELGVSQQDLVSFSGNIALALRVGGSSAQEASGALLQLSQSLGGGVVRAEEFNSVLEGAPTILQAAAAGIKEAGGSVSKLRQIMLDGKLSSKALFDGFQAGAPILEQKAAGAVYTIDQRIGNLRTSLVNAARDFNQSAAAGETFGSAIDQVAQFINGINFDSLIGQLKGVIAELNAGIATANGFGQAIGRLSGLENVGSFLTGGSGKKEFFGGALTITSTKAITDRINSAFEGEIDQVSGLTADAIKNSVLGKPGGLPVRTTDKGARLPPAILPITLDDPEYVVPGSGNPPGKGGGSGKGHDSYQSEIDSIKERTAALQAETAAQATVNPLIDDYGAAQARAQTASDLFTAAQKSGTAAGKELADVQQLLSGNFANLSPAARQQAEAMLALADGYAKATAESQRLAASQDQMRDAAQQFADAGKDVTKGFISDLMDGKSAADALGGALKKVADILLDQVLDAIFQVKGAGGSGGGGLGGLFSSIFGGGSSFPAAPSVGLFADGGYTGPGGKHSPAGVVHKGEVVWSQADIRRAGGVAAVEAMRRGVAGYANGGPVGMRAPSLPSIRRGGGQNVSVRSEVEVSVSDSGELRAYVKRTSAETAEGVSRQHIAKFSEKDLPNRFTQIEGNRRKR
ncbi:tape measure protein [Neorhizobium alkalisoli]|uniref:Tape measure domain-containing protein n=1 Tax=Neorhizobium alkalisoli TaxID=528178 RepID=A0A561QSD8_9HYPH|nr:tape measure protein [Neorhizobium alkalisoli]TWF53301.1 tape measure domain-containing protein [Neorhizobium alkalisoli]